MSDPHFRVDWSAIGALMLAALIRLIFGRAMARIEKRLTGLGELDAIRHDIAELKADVARLKRPTGEIPKVDA